MWGASHCQGARRSNPDFVHAWLYVGKFILLVKRFWKKKKLMNMANFLNLIISQGVLRHISSSSSWKVAEIVIRIWRPAQLPSIYHHTNAAQGRLDFRLGVQLVPVKTINSQAPTLSKVTERCGIFKIGIRVNSTAKSLNDWDTHWF
jgi:hypothetical protein